MNKKYIIIIKYSPFNDILINVKELRIVIFDLLTPTTERRVKKYILRLVIIMHYIFRFIDFTFMGKRVKKYILKYAIIMHYDFRFIYSPLTKKRVKKSKKIGI